MAAKRVTQRDVASRAGVSQAVVSMALSGSGGALPGETIARVLEVAKSLGYVPNRFARALKTNRTMTICCIVPDIANPFYASLVRGLQSVADDNSYDVIVSSTDGSEEKEAHFLNWCAQGRADAVVGTFFRLNVKALAPYLQNGMPIVRLEAAPKKTGPLPLHNLYIDNFSAAASVVDYLTSRGYRAICMVAGQDGPQTVRVNGYRQAMLSAGLSPHVIIKDGFNEQSGYQAVKELIATQRLPEALFAANDLIAIGAMRAARENNLPVPQKLAVIGFDDIPSASQVTPSLTTIAQFPYQIGRQAGAILLQQLSNKTPATGTTTEMPYRLIARESA